jgi:hypothetical protein
MTRRTSRKRSSLRRNSSYSTTYRSPEDKARLAVEALRDRDITDPARQQAELNLAGMYRTKSPRTAASVRRKIAAAEVERERALEALEKATFAGAPAAEQRRLKQAFDVAESERFQARMKLAEMGLRRNSADWSTRTAVAAKARAAFARGDNQAAKRYLSELSAIDLDMMPRAIRRNGRRTSRRLLHRLSYGRTP